MFDVHAIDRNLGYLDDLPPALLPLVVTASGGDLSARTTAVLTWRQALLEGRIPWEELSWPLPVVAKPVLSALRNLGILRFTRGDEQLTDLVLAEMLQATLETDAHFQGEVRRQLAELEALHRRRLDEWEALSKKQKRRHPKPKARDRQALFNLAEAEVSQGFDHSVASLEEEYGELVRLWCSLADVFGELGNALGLGWDLSMGVLRHQGWKEVLRLRELLEQLPALKELVRTLGRLHQSEDGPSIMEEVVLPMMRTEEELRMIRTPLAVEEARGITRSASVARMLPSEAVLLRHPTLRLLWHARRAERALLAYRIEGHDIITDLVEREVEVRNQREVPRPERGPIIVCLDTSGSMAGVPELVAKAVTLEAMRTAHRENRHCYLLAFSGPDQVEKLELDLSPEGLGRLLSFLSLSFHGDTDVESPVSWALSLIEQEVWSRADVLMVSDGEFDVSGNLVNRVTRAIAEGGNRFHGLRIGSHGASGMEKICDPIHNFTSWESVIGKA